MKNIIYYFTGSGNSLLIARCLRDVLGDTEIVRVCKESLNFRSNEDYEKVGFVFPVYYRGLPKMFTDFIRNLQISTGAYIFAVANYGGSAALSFEQTDKLLAEKGLKLNGAFGMAMPGNLWFMYYAHPKEDVTERNATQEKRASAIAQMVCGKVSVPAAEVAGRAEEEKFYLQISGVAERDKGFWCDDNCVGCGICAKICPAENIVLTEGRPVWQHRCEYCVACIHWCPKQAIQFENITQNKERYHNPAVKVQELFLR